MTKYPIYSIEQCCYLQQLIIVMGHNGIQGIFITAFSKRYEAFSLEVLWYQALPYK